ncbi:hypothetical protein [Gracilimonas halophila]|uniref:Spore coat protein U domain-containing protein n=1 Tax=Gracilimonas halophila TaxID=1834464 RepID=A0ABW5JK83_9BACT
MINAIRYIGFFFLLGSITSPLNAQFINLQLKVEPELSATVEQNLDFGTQVTNSGRTTVQLGDVNMGVFSIRAFHTQNLYISLQYPDQLTNEDPGIENQIPLELDMAYNNQDTNDATNANLLDANRGLVSIHERTQAEFDQEIWKEMYIYVFGAIDVGNIPNGVYTADIILTIDYD